MNWGNPQAEVNILIGSGGRRNYLVNWFRQALQEMHVPGSVCVIDATSAAPALADADHSTVVPPFASDEYFPTVAELLREWRVGLAFSLNDFEAALWAAHPASPFIPAGVNLIAASSECQALVEDKTAYHKGLASSGLQTPRSLLGSEAYERDALPWDGDVIVKHRFGSGSAGLVRTSSVEWRDELTRAAMRARDRVGGETGSFEDGLDSIVVQQAIDGVEHGLDVVHDFHGRYVTVLARRKLRMRSGETDQAITVPAGPFEALARSLGEVTKHRGLIDTDVIVDQDGVPYVIDINPRFGGGYPFSHVAGARIPQAYLGWHLGLPVPKEFLSYEVGVTAAKTEDIRVARSRVSRSGA